MRWFRRGRGIEAPSPPRDPAKERATEILLSYLTEDEAEEFKKYGRITIKTHYGTWRLDGGPLGYHPIVYQKTRSGWQSVCVYLPIQYDFIPGVNGPLPGPDVYLALYMHIKYRPWNFKTRLIIGGF